MGQKVISVICWWAAYFAHVLRLDRVFRAEACRVGTLQMTGFYFFERLVFLDWSTKQEIGRGI